MTVLVSFKTQFFYMACVCLSLFVDFERCLDRDRQSVFRLDRLCPCVLFTGKM